MKKFLAVIILLGSISYLSASSVDKNRNQVMSLGDGYVDLQRGCDLSEIKPYALYFNKDNNSNK